MGPQGWLGPETPDRYTLKMRELKSGTGQTGRETGVLRVFGCCARLASYVQSLRQSSSFQRRHTAHTVAPALGPNSEELQGSVQGSVYMSTGQAFSSKWHLAPKKM